MVVLELQIPSQVHQLHMLVVVVLDQGQT